jgi:hypothetical protein
MGEAVLKLEPEEPAALIAEDLAALESEMTPEYEEDARRELAIFRDVFHSDRSAELRAWKDGTHPLHPSQR